MNKSEVEKFIKQLIEGMYKKYGFKIEDFSFIKGIQVPWGLSKTLNDGTKIIILFISLTDSVNYETFENEICLKLNCSVESIVKVLFVNESTDSTKEQNNLNYVNTINVLPNNFISFNMISRQIHVSDSNMEAIAYQIASISDNIASIQNNRKGAYVTYTLIGINIFMFIISALFSGNFFDIDTNVLIYLGAKYNPAIEQGQWFRLLSCTFLHGGLIHIAANMYSLYSIGPLVEHLYGKLKYIILYLAAGISSSLFSFWFSDHVSIGASGAIFGLLGVLFVFAVKEREKLGKGFFINIASTVAINLYIGLSLPGIDNFGHLGGLLSGIALGSIVSLDKKN